MRRRTFEYARQSPTLHRSVAPNPIRWGSFPLGDALEVFIRREDAERFIEEVRAGDPEAVEKLRIEERELEAPRLSPSGR